MDPFPSSSWKTEGNVHIVWLFHFLPFTTFLVFQFSYSFLKYSYDLVKCETTDTQVLASTTPEHNLNYKMNMPIILIDLCSVTAAIYIISLTIIFRNYNNINISTKLNFVK